QPKGRANSKQARVLALLCGPSGATIATVTRSTGWQPHTVRAFLAAVVRKKLGLRLESEKTWSGRRVPGSHLSWWRLDCLAGHVGLELRNVDVNYPFERSHRFAGIQRNSGFGDYARLSCGVEVTQTFSLPAAACLGAPFTNFR